MKRKESPQAHVKPGKARRIAVGWGEPARFSIPIPKNEKQRLEALHKYEVLDTGPEAEFDEIAQLAALICGTPIALISLVDTDRQWFKAKVGINKSETSREIAFCAHAIMGPELFVVEDATADKRFANNPLVTAGPKIRFYAGAPLMSQGDHAIGTLCVLDHVPRHLTPEQQRALKTLSQLVIRLLEARKELTGLRRTLNQQKKL